MCIKCDAVDLEKIIMITYVADVGNPNRYSRLVLIMVTLIVIVLSYSNLFLLIQNPLWFSGSRSVFLCMCSARCIL